MRLYGGPPLEGVGRGEEVAFISDFRQTHFVFKFSHSCTFTVSSEPHLLYSINALGPNRLRTTPPVYCTFPMPRHTSTATDFNTELSKLPPRVNQIVALLACYAALARSYRRLGATYWSRLQGRRDDR